MTKRSTQHPRRRGAVAVLVAVLAIFLLGMTAFAVDIGWVVLTNHQLQNAADAAALAAADPLMDGYVRYQLARTADQKKVVIDQAKAQSRALAREFTGYNLAGGVSSLSLRDEDVEFGFIDAAGAYAAVAAYEKFPNTVRVLVRRDAKANGALPLFFGPAVGTQTVDTSATAQATVYGGGFESTTGRAGVLPMTYDVDHWDAFVATGKGPDGKSSVDASGLPQLQVYPSVKDKGNFGELSLDDSHNGSSDIRSWIDAGLSEHDLAALKANSQLPLSQRDTTQWNWSGNPGLRATTVSAVNGYTGDLFLLPLFRAKSDGTGGTKYQAGVGDGSNYDYNIVRFVGVRVMPTNRTNQEVTVQPAAYVADDLVLTDLAPAGTTTSFVTAFVTPKLTR